MAGGPKLTTQATYSRHPLHVHTLSTSDADDGLIQSDKADGETSMNGHRILGLIAVVGLAKLAFGSHRHRMGPQARGNWPDRVAELHRELHRRDAEANAQPAGTPSADAA